MGHRCFGCQRQGVSIALHRFVQLAFCPERSTQVDQCVGIFGLKRQRLLVTNYRCIELALPPYEARLRAKRPALLLRLKGLLDEVMGNFQTSEFTNDGKLSGEFLLGFHCQRSALWQKHESVGEETDEQ